MARFGDADYFRHCDIVDATWQHHESQLEATRSMPSYSYGVASSTKPGPKPPARKGGTWVHERKAKELPASADQKCSGLRSDKYVMVDKWVFQPWNAEQRATEEKREEDRKKKIALEREERKVRKERKEQEKSNRRFKAFLQKQTARTQKPHCRYGTACTRDNCWYQHPLPKSMWNPMQAPGGGNGGGGGWSDSVGGAYARAPYVDQAAANDTPTDYPQMQMAAAARPYHAPAQSSYPTYTYSQSAAPSPYMGYSHAPPSGGSRYEQMPRYSTQPHHPSVSSTYGAAPSAALGAPAYGNFPSTYPPLQTYQ